MSQYYLGSTIGPNYSKFKIDGAVDESIPKPGFSSTLIFDHLVMERIGYQLEFGYQILKNNSKIYGGSAHNPWLENGDYSLHYLCLNLKSRIVIIKDYNIGFFTGLSTNRLLHSRFKGNRKGWAYIYGDPSKDYLSYDDNVDQNITSEMSKICIDCLF